jgi:hypothetical protein
VPGDNAGQTPRHSEALRLALGLHLHRVYDLLLHQGLVRDSGVIGDQPVTPNSCDSGTEADDSPGLLGGIGFPIFARSDWAREKHWADELPETTPN